jgi:nucleoside-diphosphate-sugar epimerase
MVTAITGATGFIGGVLASELTTKGEKVRALVRKESNTKQLEALGIEMAHGDVTDPASLNDFLHGCDRLYHCAGLVDLGCRDWNLFYKVNVEGTINILEAALRNVIGRVVYSSSAATLCPENGGTLTENPPLKRQSMGYYSDSKTQAETEALKFIDRGIDVILVNPTNVFGPGSVSNINRTVLDLILGKLPGVPDTSTNLVYIDDVVEAHILGFQRGIPGRHYLVAGETVRMVDAYQMAVNMAGSSKKVRGIPLSLTWLYAYIGESLSKFTDKKPLISRAELKPVSRKILVNDSQTREELGLKKTTVKDGMEKLVAWFQHGGYFNATK